ncbi:phage portal protein [Hyphomicrobiales bacterium 4NK60-0047b]
MPNSKGHGKSHKTNNFEQKASQAKSLISMHQLGQAQWTPRDYTSFANEGFGQNAICYRCIRMIAQSAATIPLRVREEGEDYKEHPLLDLLKNPNAHQCGPDLFEEWYGYLMVAGNSYMELVSLNETPRELYVLRPDRMKIIAGEKGWPQAFQYSVNNQFVTFPIQDGTDGNEQSPILHTKLFHPTNDHYGMSPIEAAASAVDIHNAASNWNKALLDNSARPSGALIYTAKDGQLTNEQYERLQSELEENFEGAANAGKPLLLEGGLDWKNMGLSPRDMDFIEAKYIAAREIALAFGVPPMLLGIPGDNTYSNYAEANRTFWRQTILPLVERSAKTLTNWLRPSFGNSLTLKPDITEVTALTQEREALWRRLQQTDFLTSNEKRALIGYPPLEPDELEEDAEIHTEINGEGRS